MKKIVVIDNYDSFTYNLVHLIEELVGHEIDVKRNDQLDLSDLADYEYIILSPGPGIPEEAGLLKPIIKHYAADKKMLGVCLGHQAIGEVFGATLENIMGIQHKKLMVHGVQCHPESILTPQGSVIIENFLNL